MDGKKLAGLFLIAGAIAGGIYAYSRGWYGNSPVGALSDRQQSLKWMGEQLRYRGKNVDVHDFVDGGTGLSSTMEQHLSNVISRGKAQSIYEQSSNAIGRPY